jgi:palmitoyltransferase
MPKLSKSKEHVHNKHDEDCHKCDKSHVYETEEHKEAAMASGAAEAPYASNLSRSQMYSHILLMTLQSKTDCIDVEACRHLIEEKGANAFLIDCEGNTFLHWAAWRKLSEIVAYLMDELSVQPHQKNELNQTPLHWASMGGDIISVKRFIDCGLSVLQPDIDGYTSLHAAAQFNQPGILEFCKFYTNINLDFEDSKGRTALHWAVYKENPVVIEWLLENGANPCIQDIYGETAMHIAAKKNKCKAISALIDHSHGAFCFGIQNDDHKTPLDLAAENKESAHQAFRLIKKVMHRQENWWWQIFDTWTDNKYSLPSMRRFGAIVTVYFMIMQAMVAIIDVVFYMNAITDETFPNTYPSTAFALHLTLWILCFLGYLSWFVAHNSNPGIIEKPTAKEVAAMFNDMENNNLLSSLNTSIIQQQQSQQNTSDSHTNANNSSNDNNAKANANTAEDAGKYEYICNLLNGDSSKICITCRVVKPLRSKHCNACGACVRKFDHHCPWINNCIGEGNYKQFVWYLLTETIGMTFFTILTVMYCASGRWSILGLAITIPLNTMMLGLIFFNSLQIYSHIILITHGWTTNEQYNMLRYLYFRDQSGNVRNPFGHGCMRNWLQFLCGVFGFTLEMLDIEKAPMFAKIRKPEKAENMDDPSTRTNKSETDSNTTTTTNTNSNINATTNQSESNDDDIQPPIKVEIQTDTNSNQE